MNNTIRIGTRGSRLALWQANTVKNQLETLGYNTALITVATPGDLSTTQPLYEIGITGIFTKTLDTAMINGTVDIAVHSMKDVPTALPKGIVAGAVLKRGAVHDVLIFKKSPNPPDKSAVIATGSLRRKAQWLNKYPHHNIVNLRGNVNTRLQKLNDNPWNGAIFARAGLERLEQIPENHTILDWMLPAPAQGAILVTAMENDTFSIDALSKISHSESAICTHIERQFLRVLEGGCTAPIGALATLNDDHIQFKGGIYSLDGTQKAEIQQSIAVSHAEHFGKKCAQQLLTNGGDIIMKEIKAMRKK
ncbi:MAG: hydroxymethylbilane synthase [Bacteroidota bacterium]